MKYKGNYPDTTGRSAIEFYCDLLQTTIGERIKLYRKAAGKTQSELGELCGVNPANLRKYESGRQTPKYETLERIADALGTYVFVIYSPDDFAADYMVNSGILRRWFDDIAIEEAKRSDVNADEILSELLGLDVRELSNSGTRITTCKISPDFYSKVANLAHLMGHISAGDIPDAAGAAPAQVEQLLQDFNKLNSAGQEKALERVHELTEVPRYTSPAVTPAPASTAESVQAAPQSPAGGTDTHKEG